MPYPSVVKFVNWITGQPIALEDAIASSFGGIPNNISLIARSVDFNAIGDTLFSIIFPGIFSRFLLNSVKISHASGSLSTATFGVFSAVAGGGTALIAGGTAITVTTSAENTANNAQTVLGPTNTSYNFTSVYFRVTNPQGAAVTGDVEISITPVS